MNQFENCVCVYSWRLIMHPRHPGSGDAYSDRELTPNFELWVEFPCVPTCFHMQYIVDTSMEKTSRVLQHGNPKIWISFQKRSNLIFDLIREFYIMDSWEAKKWIFSRKTCLPESFCCHVLWTMFRLYCAHCLVKSCSIQYSSMSQHTCVNYMHIYLSMSCIVVPSRVYI